MNKKYAKIQQHRQGISYYTYNVDQHTLQIHQVVPFESHGESLLSHRILNIGRKCAYELQRVANSSRLFALMSAKLYFFFAHS